jgi:hypothetical protein
VLTPSGTLQIRSPQKRCLGVSADNLIQEQDPDGSDLQLWQLRLEEDG